MYIKKLAQIYFLFVIDRNYINITLCTELKEIPSNVQSNIQKWMIRKLSSKTVQVILFFSLSFGKTLFLL